jgi:hypothetical protein
MQKVYLIFSLLPLLSCQGQQPAGSPARVGVPVEHVVATKDKQARWAQSEVYCRAHGVPYYKNPTAMFTDSESETTLRTKDQVVDRALSLLLVGLKSEGMSPAQLAKIDKSYHISSKFTPDERAYVVASSPTEQQRTDANWRYEGLHVLLWALGYIPALAYPDRMCEVAPDVKIIHDLTEAQFRQRAKLRSKKEILDQADLILRLDWACTEARLKKQPAPGELNSDAVVERHHALNWLIKYGDQEWDDVSTDT